MIIDRSSPLPVYFQIALHLEHAINSGDIPDGSLLESQCSLARRLGVSVPTIRAALQYLTKHAIISPEPGGCMRVTHPVASPHRAVAPQVRCKSADVGSAS